MSGNASPEGDVNGGSTAKKPCLHLDDSNFFHNGENEQEDGNVDEINAELTSTAPEDVAAVEESPEVETEDIIVLGACHSGESKDTTEDLTVLGPEHSFRRDHTKLHILIAKIANGICDNLLTCLVRAWDPNKPLFFCPAMNSYMLEHPLTFKHFDVLKNLLNYKEIPCVEKELMCGDKGYGAMAPVQMVASVVAGEVKKRFAIISRS